MPPSRRNELIDAAMEIFYRNGFQNTGLDQIQRESGISKMTLYNHFKSKDELILAALRRKDEITRNQLMKHVESGSKDPIQRLLSVFDFYEAWFLQDSFNGCMFVNAAAEYCDTDCSTRRVAADFKLEVTRYLKSLCTDADLRDPSELAEELSLLLEGAIASAQIVGKASNNPQDLTASIHRAQRMGHRLIDNARV